jgi:hypothetical protein
MPVRVGSGLVGVVSFGNESCGLEEAIGGRIWAGTNGGAAGKKRMPVLTPVLWRPDPSLTTQCLSSKSALAAAVATSPRRGEMEGLPRGWIAFERRMT